MDGMILPIVIAVSVALLIWGVMQIITGGSKEKQKIKDRLQLAPEDDPVLAQRRSILLQMQASGVSGTLAQIPMFQELYRKLLQAWPELSISRFLLIVGGMGFFSFLIMTAIFGTLLIGCVSGLVGGYMPFMVLNMKRNRRQRMIADQLPEALEFLSRILKAGHSVSTGMQTVSEEMPDPLASEFRRCYDQHSLGQPLEESLKEMSTRVGSTDFAFFVTAVLIQRTTGGDLSEVLNNISGMIRQRIRLGQSVKAKTAEGRFTGYILVALPIILFFVAYALNPKYAEVLLKTPTGLKLLGVATVLIVMGLWSIRKITTIKV